MKLFKKENPTTLEEINVLDVANYYIYQASKVNKSLNGRKLNCLLYFAQGYHLALTGVPLFSDEISIKNRYLHIKEIHDYVIIKNGRYHNFEFMIQPFQTRKTDFDKIYAIHQKTKGIIEAIWKSCHGYNYDVLMRIIRDQDPWQKAIENEHPHIITKDSLENYYLTDILVNNLLEDNNE